MLPFKDYSSLQSFQVEC